MVLERDDEVPRRIHGHAGIHHVATRHVMHLEFRALFVARRVEPLAEYIEVGARGDMPRLPYHDKITGVIDGHVGVLLGVTG